MTLIRYGLFLMVNIFNIFDVFTKIQFFQNQVLTGAFFAN